MGTELLPQVCRTFRDAYPRSQLKLTVDGTTHILEKLRAAELDLAMVEGAIDDQQFCLEPLCDDEMALVCAPSHPWSDRQRVSVSELSGESFFVRESGSGTRETFESTMATLGLSWINAGEIGGGTAILALVAANLGVAFLSRRTIRTAAAKGEVRIVEVEKMKMVRTFHLAIHGNKRMSPALVSFTRAAHEVARREFP